MTELVYEDEIYERIIELEHKAKGLWIKHSEWEYILDMLDKDERKEYDELMIMWDEIQEDYKTEEARRAKNND